MHLGPGKVNLGPGNVDLGPSKVDLGPDKVVTKKSPNIGGESMGPRVHSTGFEFLALPVITLQDG